MAGMMGWILYQEQYQEVSDCVSISVGRCKTSLEGCGRSRTKPGKKANARPKSCSSINLKNQSSTASASDRNTDEGLIARPIARGLKAPTDSQTPAAFWTGGTLNPTSASSGGQPKWHDLAGEQSLAGDRLDHQGTA
jgi:hypothetical protein